MSDFVFCPPEGGIIQNPSADFLKQIILTPDEAYWLRGSADGGLHFKGGSQQSQMILRFRKGLGFCVYFEANRKELPLVLSSNPNDREMVELREGGNILKLPRSHFVEPAIAWPAVAEFMKSGNAMSGGHWIVFSPEEEM